MTTRTLDGGELFFHRRLVAQIQEAANTETKARAALQLALESSAKAQAQMQTWVDHLTVLYGLKESDVVDAQGVIHFLDPTWEEPAEIPLVAATPLPFEDVQEPVQDSLDCGEALDADPNPAEAPELQPLIPKKVPLPLM